MLREFQTRSDEPLRFLLDPEKRLAMIPRDHAIKGIFCIPKMRELGADFAKVEPRLLAPPRLGRYLPFSDYPVVDCARLSFAAAAKAHPSELLVEACRRVARRDMEVFTRSKLGGVILSLFRDPESVLLKMPDVWRVILSGSRCTAQKRAGGGVRVEFTNVWGTLDNFQIGTLEGVVLYFGAKPVMEVQLLSVDYAIYDVSWA